MPTNEIDLRLADLQLLVDDATVTYMRAQALARAGLEVEANSLVLATLSQSLLKCATAEQAARTTLEADLVAGYKPADHSYEPATLEHILRLNDLARRASEMAGQVANVYRIAGGGL